MSNRLPLSTTITASATIAAITPSIPSAAELAIEEVVVTASRIGAVDRRVVVMDEEEVDDAPFHAADAIRALPGLALSSNGQRGSLT